MSGMPPTTTTLLKDLEVKAAVQHNETLCPVITDLMSTGDDHFSLSSSADVSAPPPQLKPDCNVELERSGVVAPPLTARNAQNPVVERNTHRGSSEELIVEGNTLVPRHAADHTAADTTVTESQPDVTQSRHLSALRPDQLHRISYVQNVVDSALPSGPTATGPKVLNVDSQSRRPCDDDASKPLSADEDDNASHNTAAAAAAGVGGDNLGYEPASSPSSEAVAATSLLV